ncbi:hypothetical protein Poli38472_003728 [Pythium oligandrum]|uniref:Gamma-interferon-inducible lysosomal thiol reductase n=1 Tax=Pythium oligandrum TaxID=41045 RepID=A0A8K1CPD9_PYTOL|nr:hypothetical protein Poli38472_003728 [Pythium oligandrum]|eukprot:TMW65963.1 hypothetical protein Poli38472_003728 [Pythium oligandrum]
MKTRVVASCVAFMAAASLLTPVTAVAPKRQVNLEVYFRAYCPACQWFVGDPLLELMRNEQFRNIINLSLYPAAGMLEKDGVFDCEGGDLECEGHRWEACTIEKDRNDVVKYLGNVACIEGDESGDYDDWPTKLQNCFTPDERAELQECYDKRSTDILRAMINTENADKVQWMPYTIVNGEVMGSATSGVGITELQTSICSAYKGPKKYYPEPCFKVVGEQKEFAPEEPVQTPAATLKQSPEPPALAAAATVAPVSATPAFAEAALHTEPPEETPAAVAAAQVEEEEEEIDMPMKGDEEDDPDFKGNGKLRLELYWRAFCPGCRGFITKPLLKLLRDPQFRDNIDFRPVPAAGTTYDAATGAFVCNNGKLECVGHKWLSCAIDEFPQVEEMIEHLACLESKDNKGKTWNAIIDKCFTTTDRQRMRSCFDTKSTELLQKHIAEREKVDISWVPYVRINDAPIGDARHGIGYKQLQDEVCKAYTGSIESRPSACQPKRLREDDTHDKESEAPAIKPCPPKKDGAAAKAEVDAVAADAPGAGFRRPVAQDEGDATTKEVQEARALAGEGGFGGAAKRDAAVPADSGFSPRALLFPLGCFVIVGLLARRLSGDHKKAA